MHDNSEADDDFAIPAQHARRARIRQVSLLQAFVACPAAFSIFDSITAHYRRSWKSSGSSSLDNHQHHDTSMAQLRLRF